MVSTEQINDILQCSSLLEVKYFIMTEVTDKYEILCRRKYNLPPLFSGNGNRKLWLNKVYFDFGKEMKAERIELLEHVPDKFKKTDGFVELYNKIHGIVALPQNKVKKKSKVRI